MRAGASASRDGARISVHPKLVYEDDLNPAMRAAVEEMRERTAAGFSGTAFDVEAGEDPTGTYLVATVDIEDTDGVMDLIGDRLLDIQIEERLPLYVVVLRTPARVMHALHEL